MTKTSQTRKDECFGILNQLLQPGTKVYTVLRHVSRTGMSRKIDLYVMQDGEPRYISKTVADVLDMPCKGDGISISGCGMDVGFEIVYQLGRKMYPRGFKVEGRGRNGDTSGWDKDGGYALKQSWL